MLFGTIAYLNSGRWPLIGEAYRHAIIRKKRHGSRPMGTEVLLAGLLMFSADLNRKSALCGRR